MNNNSIIKFTDNTFVGKRLKYLYWRIKNIPCQYRIEKGIRQRKKGIEDSKYATIQKYKNMHKGERCFIVATGPSLTMDDLELLKNEITFGMNSITKVFDNTTWRPSYYGIQDRQVYEKMEHSILQYYAESKNVFVADELAELYKMPSQFIRFPYNGNYHLYAGKYGTYTAQFSDNAYEVIYDGYSITYSLIQIAIYMGFSEICLLGCDCNYPKGEKNHFVESGFVDKNAHTNPERMLVGYKKAKEYADVHGIKIINCTRGGMLEVFPRKLLEDCVGKKKLVKENEK